MNMDADTRAKLAEGVAALVRAAMAPGGEYYEPPTLTPVTWRDNEWNYAVGGRCPEGAEPPPLTLTQTLGLRLLLGDTDPGLCAAAVDALVESEVIPGDQVELIRQAERERCAAVAEDAAHEWNTTADYWRARDRYGSADRCEGRAAGASCLADKFRRND